MTINLERIKFSSPFIEERLYLKMAQITVNLNERSRPLLSRSGCISTLETNKVKREQIVLVPFYRGAVVFREL